LKIGRQFADEMDCIFGPVWLHSVDWTHRVGSTAAGVFQEATCEVTENSDVNRLT